MGGRPVILKAIVVEIERLLKSGSNQSAIARLVHVTQGSVSRIARGTHPHQQPPKAPKPRKVANQYSPIADISPEGIAAQCREFQASWTEGEERHHRTGSSIPVPYELPMVEECWLLGNGTKPA